MGSIEVLERPAPRVIQSTAALVGERSKLEVPPHLREPLAMLLQAYDYARDLRRDVWDLAVELEVLRASRLTNSDLRWLACKGYVEHAVETTRLEDEARAFRPTAPLCFSDLSCVVLTPAGAVVARALCQVPQGGLDSATGAVDSASVAGLEESTLPKWDHQRRQLRVGPLIVKEFKLPSANQETVLMAFEEECWPARIDDPLAPASLLDPRRRLHDTIKGLNRNQRQNLIRFMGDGSGEGIRWEFTSAVEAALRPARA